MTSAPPPHPNDIRRIAALTDPVLRALFDAPFMVEQTAALKSG